MRVPLSTVSDSEAVDLSRTIARRVKAAVNGDNVPALKDTLADVSEPLAAALDVDGTDRSAESDTVVVGAETREPTRQPTRFPTRQPTIRPTVRPGEVGCPEDGEFGCGFPKGPEHEKTDRYGKKFYWA